MKQTIYCCEEPMKLKAKWNSKKDGMIIKMYAVLYCLSCGREIREELDFDV